MKVGFTLLLISSSYITYLILTLEVHTKRSEVLPNI